MISVKVHMAFPLSLIYKMCRKDTGQFVSTRMHLQALMNEICSVFNTACSDYSLQLNNDDIDCEFQAQCALGAAGVWSKFVSDGKSIIWNINLPVHNATKTDDLCTVVQDALEQKMNIPRTWYTCRFEKDKS